MLEHFAHAGFFFFFFFLPLACFWQGSLAGISWIYKEGYSTSWETKVNKSNIILKTLTLKKKLEQVTQSEKLRIFMLNLYGALCQLHLNKTGNEKNAGLGISQTQM